MKKGGTGGGNTITGLKYEAKVDLGTFYYSYIPLKELGLPVPSQE